MKLIFFLIETNSYGCYSVVVRLASILLLALSLCLLWPGEIWKIRAATSAVTLAFAASLFGVGFAPGMRAACVALVLGLAAAGLILAAASAASSGSTTRCGKLRRLALSLELLCIAGCMPLIVAHLAVGVGVHHAMRFVERSVLPIAREVAAGHGKPEAELRARNRVRAAFERGPYLLHWMKPRFRFEEFQGELKFYIPAGRELAFYRSIDLMDPPDSETRYVYGAWWRWGHGDVRGQWGIDDRANFASVEESFNREFELLMSGATARSAHSPGGAESQTR